MQTHLMVGDLLYGYCGGYFGRDSYEDKRIEAIGIDWVVCRDEFGDIHMASGKDIHKDLVKYLDEKWKS